jgi:hypothetical protein
MNTSKKITLSTVKKFIKENAQNLYANCKSDFNGMSDCVESVNTGFKKVDSSKIDMLKETNLGIELLWFVRGSRDYFRAYNENGFVGIEISNCCGCSIIATKQN